MYPLFYQGGHIETSVSFSNGPWPRKAALKIIFASGAACKLRVEANLINYTRCSDE